MCLIYMISMHYSHRNSMYPSIHAKHVECDYFPLPSKFEMLAFQPLGNFSHMAACRSSSENTRKMNLITIFNKTSPHAHIESELDVLGVLRKLMKYVVYSSKRKN